MPGLNEIVFAYLAVGAFAGVIAGLFGVGGGLIIVPVLVMVFSAVLIDNTHIVHTAIGTSLLTIVVTAISATVAHHRRGAVLWQDWWMLTPGMVIGALSGAAIADRIPDAELSRIFGVFEIAVAAWMYAGRASSAHASLPRYWVSALVSWVIGCVSAIVGIGGGTMTVPFLVWSQRTMQNAVATSSACGLPIAMAGAAGFIIAGLDEGGLESGNWGYVYWPAAVAIMITSASFAPLGARLAHRWSAEKLRKGFSLLLMLLGLQMLFGH